MTETTGTMQEGWHGVKANLWPWLLLIGGIVSAWFYYKQLAETYKTPLTDFAIWSPTVLGMSIIEYQIIWGFVSPFRDTYEMRWAILLFFVVLGFNALLVG